MRDVIEQLASYQDHLDTAFPAVEASEVLDSPAVELETLTAPRRLTWRPAIALGAAFAVLIAVGLPVLLFGGGDPVDVVEPSTTVDPIVTTVPPTTVAPVATTVPPVVPATPMTWERIDDPAAFGGDLAQRMVGAAQRDGLVVAVGSDRSGGDLDAAIWYSFDGKAWTRVPHDESVFGGDGHQQINDVATVGSGFVAVGSEGDDANPLTPNLPPSESFETHAAVWYSDDGIIWSRAPHHDALSGGEGGVVMKDVAFDGTSLVAVGAEYHPAVPFAIYRWDGGPGRFVAQSSDPVEIDTDVDAAVWRSDDGVAWTRVDNEGDVFGGDTVRQTMNAVVAGDRGYVAVGYEGFDYLGIDDWTPDGVYNSTPGRAHVADNVAAVWTSPDGETWTRVTGEPSLAHSGGEVVGWATMVDITATDSGLVAVGRDAWDSSTGPGWSDTAAVWRSGDGLSWYRSNEPGELGSSEMRGVTTTGDGYVIAGGGLWDYITVRMWSSQNDGDTWFEYWGDDKTIFGGTPTSREDAEAYGPASIQAVTSFGGEAIAVGYMGDDAAVWIGTWNSGGG